jgi:ankyrin repeat protein
MADQDEIHRIYNASGVDVNAQSARGFTQLMMSVMLNNLPAMRSLLALPGIDVNSGNLNGNTALHMAALRGQDIHLETLLADARIDTRVLNFFGETALCIAIKHNRAIAVEALLHHQLLTGHFPPFPPDEALKAYTLASDHNAFNVIHSLLHVMPEFLNVTRADGHTALTAAIKANRPDVVRALLKKYPEINVNLAGEGQGTALNTAANLPNFECLLILLRHPELNPNVHLDASGNTVLHRAASRGDANVVQVLMSALPTIDINVTASGIKSPLHHAVLSGDVDTIRVLAARANNINERCKDGWSALHYAAFSGKVEPVLFLMQLPNIDRAAMTRTGHYASDIAIDFGHADVAQILNGEELQSFMHSMRA